MNNNVLGLNDFIGGGKSINLDIFTDIEKAISVEEFQEKYKGHSIFTKEKVVEFVKDVRSRANELNKAVLSSVDVIEKANTEFKKLQRVDVMTKNGITSVFVMPADDSIEKGILSDAIGYPSDKNNLSFDKTGKEIKEKLQPFLTIINNKILETRSEMAKCLEECGILPTQGWDEWDRPPQGCEEYKKYPYSMCYYDGDRNKGTMGVAENAVQEVKVATSASSQKQADACKKYNSCVSKICDMTKDKIHAESLLRNLEDKKSYTLSLAQIASLGF